MRRFFGTHIVDGHISLTGSDVTHIKDVLRMSVDDDIIISVDGTDYISAIQEIRKDSIECVVLKQVENLAEPKVKVTLYQGLPKAEKMELIIQKCVELGITRIVPVACARSIVKLNAKDGEKKIARWQKIATEASKQCGRGVVPTIENVCDVRKISNDYDLAILFWEMEKDTRYKDILKSGGTEIALFVGPEGGITEDEVALLKEKGFRSATLGHRILRTETAGMAALSALMYEFDELG